MSTKSRAQQRRSARGPEPALSPFTIVLAVVGVLIVVGVIFAVATRDDGDGGPTDKAGEYSTHVIADGASLPKFDATVTPDPAVGKTAPAIHSVDFTGNSAAISANGKPHMVVFLAHWCPHCNREAPRLKAYLDNAGKPGDIDIDLVPTGSDPSRVNWPPSSWIKTMGLGNLITVVDSKQGEISAAYGLDGYPYIVLLDKDLKVVARYSGEQQDGFFAQAIAKLQATIK